MPRIKEYGQALEYQASGVTSSAGLRHSGVEGRAIQELGEGIQQVGDQIYKRQEQEETSDLNANFAELGADVSQEIDEGTQNGTIDAQKYVETVQQRVDKLSDGISTRAGRFAFERNSARLTAQAAKRAARGQAAVAGAKAQANLGTELAGYSSAVFTDPTGYDTAKEAFNSSLGDQVATGALKAVDAEKIRRAGNKDLAMAAGRGWAQIDPDMAEKKLNSGALDGDIDGDQKAQLQTYIDGRRSANLVEVQRKDALEKKAEKLKRKSWIAKNISGIASGTLSTDEIMNAPGDPMDNLKLLEVVSKNARDGGGVSNPAVISDVHTKMLLPDGTPGKIVDESQIFDLVGRGMSMDDAKDAIRDLDDTPDGKAMRASQSSALAVAKKTILQRGLMFYGTGVNSGASQQQLENWIKDTRNLRNQYLKDGKNVSDLYNSKSPNYVGSPEFLKQYQIQTGSQQYWTTQGQEAVKNQAPVPGNLPDPNARQKKANGALESYSEWKTRTSK